MEDKEKARRKYSLWYKRDFRTLYSTTHGIKLKEVLKAEKSSW